MKNVKVNDTHNFALIGHSGEGKTSLGEAILHVAGATHSLGSVTEGTSVLNFLPEEKERHTTISSSIYGFDWADKHLTLVDTPGDSNFQAEGRIILAGLDGGVLVVSAVGGAKVGTQRMFRSCREGGIPVIAFVNNMDRDRADFDAALESLREMDASPAVVTLPIGSEANLSGIVDLLRMKAVTPAGEADVPADLADAASAAREALMEAVAECDDVLLEKYLEEGDLSEEEMTRGLVTSTRQGSLTPVLCGSAIAEIGVATLLRAITELLPSAADRPPWKAQDAAGAEVELEPSPEAPFAGLVVRTSIDRYAGTLSVLRVVAGKLKSDMTVLDATSDSKERLGKLLLLKGEEHEDVPEAGPGDLVAVAKLKSVKTGDALMAEKGGLRLPEIAIPQGVISYAIQAKSKGDEDKVHSALGRLVEEDPTLHLGREASTGEFLLTGMGELHIRITVQKLRRMFGVEVELKTPKVPYRETITRRAENIEGKLKKQTGGKGMFGVCYLTVEPRPRGEGIEFVNEVVGGSIPRNLIPAVEKGVYEACVQGPLAGYPVVDLRVRCIDGKFHSVDSNEMAFKLAGSFGFKNAVEQAKPTLLEPIMNVETSAPADYVGDIMGDVSSRRGRVQASQAQGSGAVVQAQVPMAEMLEYASSLTSMTGGQGEFTMEFSHYEETPAQVREKIIAEANAAKADAS
ncbi:MAG: elongation factor G [Deltaproteobacteria bacterium]|nr:elongation factor G [Deltaproteobacteria bacterium]